MFIENWLVDVFFRILTPKIFDKLGLQSQFQEYNLKFWVSGSKNKNKYFEKLLL